VWYDELGPIFQSLITSLTENLSARSLGVWILRLDGRHFLEYPPATKFFPAGLQEMSFRTSLKGSGSAYTAFDQVEIVDPEGPPHTTLVLESLFPEFVHPPLGYPRAAPSGTSLYRFLDPTQPLCQLAEDWSEDLPPLQKEPGEERWICRLQNKDQCFGLIGLVRARKRGVSFPALFENAWESQISHWERLQLEATLVRRTETLEAIQAVGNTITSQLEIHDILQSVVEQATVLMKAKTASLMLVDSGNKELVIESVYGSSPDYIRKPNLDIDNSLIGRVVRSGRPVMVRDVRSCQAYQHRELASSEGLVSLLSVPLRWRDTCMGALNVYSARRYRYTEDNVYLLTMLASQSAIAIQNARTLSQAKRLEEQVHDLDKRSLVGELAAGVAHEIRNPLAVVKMLIDSWESHNETEQEDIQVISTQLKGINRCVSQLLEIARPRPPEMGWVNLAREIPAILQLLRVRLRDQGIDVFLDIKEGTPSVQVDPSRFRQLVMNLLLNALNAMPQGGKISVHAERWGVDGFYWLPGQVIVAPGTPAQDREGEPVYSLFSLTDTGGGIRDEEVRGIFEPFRSRTPGGFGLGLSVVKRIAEEHQTGVKVFNEPGSGLTFHLLMLGGWPEEWGKDS